MKSDELTQKLLSLEKAKDRGKLSHLRRWWSPTTRHYAYPVIAGLAGGQAIDNSPICTVAALFAEHPQHSDKSKNFGSTCRAIAGKNRDTFETHFRRLLASDDLENDLAPTLQRIMRRAKKEGAAVNYTQLHKDLNKWRFASEDIKTNWAKEYWSVPDESQLEIPDA